MKKRYNRGITLVALVITTIILLILASIATYSGISVVRSSKLTAFTTEMKIMQTKVNEIYQKYKDGDSIEIDGTKYYGENKKGEETTILDIGQALDSVNTQANKVFTESASGITDMSGYKYWNNELVKKIGIDGVDGDFFVNVEKRSIVSYDGFTYEGKNYYTLNELPDNLYNVENVEVNHNKPTFDTSVKRIRINESKWKITISNIKYDGPVNKWYIKYKKDGDTNWKTTEDMEFTVSETGTYIIKLENGEIKSEERKQKVGLEPGDTASETEIKNYIDKNGDMATIPGGFTISKIDGETTIVNGLVIYDIPQSELSNVDWTSAPTKYNQFVWIPVADAKYYVKDFSYPSKFDSMSTSTDSTKITTDGNNTTWLPTFIRPSVYTIANNETAEKNAVMKYNGFYIARYEAGMLKNDNKLIVRKGMSLINNASDSNSIYQDSIRSVPDFVILANDMYKDNKYVGSAMCSGTQWDVLMKFIDNKKDGQGNVFNVRVINANRHVKTSNPIKTSEKLTGSNNADKVQNLYDLEGNYFEYVAERNSVRANGTRTYVTRGGGSDYSIGEENLRSKYKIFKQRRSK